MTVWSVFRVNKRCGYLRGGPELLDESVAEEARVPTVWIPHRSVALGHLRWPRLPGHIQREVVGSEVSVSYNVVIHVFKIVSIGCLRCGKRGECVLQCRHPRV